MSNKKIQKRLKEIFDDIQQPEKEITGKKATSEHPIPGPVDIQQDHLPQNEPEDLASGRVEISDYRQPITETVQSEIEETATVLSLPFKLDTETWAEFHIPAPDSGKTWGQDKQLLAKQVVDQLSLALENARLFQQTQKQASELEILNEMGRELSSLLDVSGVVDTVYRYTGKLMDTTNFFVAIYNPETQYINFPIAINNNQKILNPDRPLGNELTDHIIRTRTALLITEDVVGHTKKLGLDSIPLVEDTSPQCWMGVPILLGEDTLGVISLQSIDKVRLYDNHHLELLNSIANQAAIALQNSRLFQQTQIRAEELAVLNEMGRQLSSSTDLDAIVQAIYQYTSRLMNTDGFYIALYDKKQDMVAFPIAVEHGKSSTIASRKAGNGLTEYVTRKGEPLLLEDSTAEKIRALGIDFIGSASRCWMGIPMLIGSEPIGVIGIEDYDNPYAFTLHSRNLMTSIASQAAIALENARLFRETETRNVELSTINEIISSASQSLELKEILEIVLEQTMKAVAFDGGLITMFNEDRGKLERIAQIGMPASIPEDPSVGIEDSLCGIVFKAREVVVVEDFRVSAPIDVSSEIDSGFLSYAGIPLEVKGHILGTLCGFRKQAGFFGENTLTLLRSIGRQVGFAVENARLFQQAELRAKDMIALNDLGRTLTSSLSLDEILDEVYRGVSRLVDTTNFYISLYDPEKNENSFPLNVTESEIDKEILRLPADQGITGYIVHTGERILIKKGVNQWLESKGMASVGEPASSWLGVPLILGDNILGVLAVQNYKEENAYDEHDEAMLTAIANQTAIAIQNARLFQEIHQRSEELSLINRVVSSAATSLDLSEAFNIAMEEIVELLPGIGRAGLAILDESRSTLTVAAEHKLKNNSTSALGIKMPLAENPASRQVIETRKPVFIKDAQHSLLISTEMRNEFKSLGVVSLAIFPIITGSAATGTIGLDIMEEGVVFSDEQIRLAETIILQTSTALQNARLFDQIRSSESRFRDVANISGDYIWETDLDWAFTYVSGRVKDVTGYSPEELLGNSNSILYGSENAKKLSQLIISEINKSGKATDIENIIFHKEDRKANMLTNAVPIMDAYGKRIGYRGVDKDITERKRSEELLKRNNEYLAVSAEIGRLVTSTLDLNTLFTRTVNLIRDRFGYYHASIFIVEETGFNAVLQEATGEAGKMMKARQHSLSVGSRSVVGTAASTGQPVVVNDTQTDSIHLPNPLLPDTHAEAGIPLRIGKRIIGTIDIQSTQVEAFTDDDVRVLQSLADQVAVAIDNARSYELSQAAVKEMRELDRLKDQFLANMSHELRTPLNSIIGFSRVILKGIDGPVSELQEQDLNAIYNSGQHLLRLINDILDLSKIEAGKMELAFDEVNLEDTINSVLPTVNGLIKDKPIKLEKAITKDLPTIRGDAMRIRQVLINLLSNASKFTEQGTITVAAGLDIGPQGQEEVVVKIIDTGPGISPEDFDKLFQPFSQVDSSPTRKTGGTGLGLSISRHLIEMHGGRLDVHSTVGEGSTFFFALPTKKTKDQSTPSDIDRTKRIVLAIDDDAQVISLYERYLQPQGYEVVALTDPTQSKQRARQLRPYAITLDIMMPEQNGWNVLRDLKMDPETRDIPVIICSILEESEKGFNLGATDYLVKPVIEDDLLNALKNLNRDGSIKQVLVIDDDINTLRLLEKILEKDQHYKGTFAEGGNQGWELLTSHPPDAVILDLFMPDMNGFMILEKMLSTPTLQGIPVIVISGADLTPEEQAQLTNFGHGLIRKGSINETSILEGLEQALKRINNS